MDDEFIILYEVLKLSPGVARLMRHIPDLHPRNSMMRVGAVLCSSKPEEWCFSEEAVKNYVIVMAAKGKPRHD